METRDFCYWLQGFAELNGEAPTPAQWELILEHLNLVFNKKTSSLPKSGPYHDPTRTYC
jgi:hypothetical protein